MRYCLFILSLLVTSGITLLRAELPAAAMPPAAELRELLQAHVPGVTAAELDRAMAAGLLEAFRGRVLLGAEASSSGTNVLEFRTLEERILSVRVSHLTAGFASRLAEEIAARSGTNQWIGLVLDLRFSSGEDYAAAAAVGDLFERQARPLLDWGAGVVAAQAKTNACEWPVVVLVNRETKGAAEAAAALLRELGAALIVGNTTAGAARTGAEFRLSTGQSLRIASRAVKLGNGAVLPESGIEPDIRVPIPIETERLIWGDPYGEQAAKLAGTNAVAGATNSSPRRIRTNEADLVRARREGVSVTDESLSARPVVIEAPTLRDPVLVRAVDVLKGLAVVRRAR